MINLTIEPLNIFILRKVMSQKYKLLYYLKRVYVDYFFLKTVQTNMSVMQKNSRRFDLSKRYYGLWTHILALAQS